VGTSVVLCRPPSLTRATFLALSSAYVVRCFGGQAKLKTPLYRYTLHLTLTLTLNLTLILH